MSVCSLGCLFIEHVLIVCDWLYLLVLFVTVCLNVSLSVCLLGCYVVCSCVCLCACLSECLIVHQLFC